MCRTGVVHIRELEGKPLSFGHSGWLWHNSYLLYDRGTDSIWHHQTGRAMSGPLRGRALARLPTVLVRWDAWRNEHPDTLVLAKRVDAPGDPTVDEYADRTAGLSLGLSVEVGRSVRMYPLHSLARVSLCEDTVEDTPLVVVFDPEAGAAFAYDRRVEGETLGLELQRLRSGAARLRERGGTRAWRLRSGRPVGPEAEHPPLRRVLTTTWDRVAWARQHPHGTVWAGK